MADWGSVWQEALAALDVEALRTTLRAALPPDGDDPGDGAEHRDADGADPLPEVVDALVAGFTEALLGGPEPAHRSYLDYVLPGAGTSSRTVAPEPKAALLMLLVLLDAGAAARARHHFGRWQAALAAAAPDERTAWACRFLADGWWFAAAFDLAPVRAAEAARVRAALLDLALPTAGSDDGNP
ncbi:hypothetical protein ACFFKU_09615 [Kineococcus gynurae]|uniref:TetR transcriptional regulator CgmR-like C-terminal domain-containing protein n=1 Tax=Kineococcus gynurae TaxID=452979 RepID=A0ABV5LVE5_9ACTN